MKLEGIAKGVVVLGFISLLSYTGGQASAPYMVEEYAEIKNELWRYKQALAGVIKKVIHLEQRVSEAERNITELKEATAKLEGELVEDANLCSVTVPWLRIRRCPSTECMTVGFLRRGMQVYYTETVSGWRKVFKPLGGYVYAKYCR